VANKELVQIKEKKKRDRAKRLEEIRATGNIISVTSLVPFFKNDINAKEGKFKYDV